jgi:hypothetical protein
MVITVAPIPELPINHWLEASAFQTISLLGKRRASGGAPRAAPDMHRYGAVHDLLPRMICAKYTLILGNCQWRNALRDHVDYLSLALRHAPCELRLKPG